MSDSEKTIIRLTSEDYRWLWEERRPGESFKKTFTRLRGELTRLREEKAALKERF